MVPDRMGRQGRKKWVPCFIVSDDLIGKIVHDRTLREVVAMQETTRNETGHKWVIYRGNHGLIMDAYDKFQALLRAREIFTRRTGNDVAIQELDARPIYELIEGVYC